jgi:hypothetical protein
METAAKAVGLLVGIAFVLALHGAVIYGVVRVVRWAWSG